MKIGCLSFAWQNYVIGNSVIYSTLMLVSFNNQTKDRCLGLPKSSVTDELLKQIFRNTPIYTRRRCDQNCRKFAILANF